MIKIDYNSNIKNKYSKNDLQKVADLVSKKEKKVTGLVEINMVGDKEITIIRAVGRRKTAAARVRIQKGKGNIQVHSQKDQRCLCNVCGQTFATTKGTIFYRFRHAPELAVNDN